MCKYFFTFSPIALNGGRGGGCGKNAILLDIDEYCHDAKAEHVVNCCDAYPEVEYCYDAEAPVVCYGAKDVVA